MNPGILKMFTVKYFYRMVHQKIFTGSFRGVVGLVTLWELDKKTKYAFSPFPLAFY